MYIKPGKYIHFKGSEYEVIGVAAHSEINGFILRMNSPTFAHRIQQIGKRLCRLRIIPNCPKTHKSAK
jgi:hypothetical protein